MINYHHKSKMFMYFVHPPDENSFKLECQTLISVCYAFCAGKNLNFRRQNQI